MSRFSPLFYLFFFDSETARFPASLLSLFCDKDTKLSRRSTTLILSREKQWRRKSKIGNIYLSAGYDTDVDT